VDHRVSATVSDSETPEFELPPDHHNPLLNRWKLERDSTIQFHTFHWQSHLYSILCFKPEMGRNSSTSELKVVFMGDKDTGKSSYLRSLVTHRFDAPIAAVVDPVQLRSGQIVPGANITLFDTETGQLFDRKDAVASLLREVLVLTTHSFPCTALLW
jgi:hypothetical protein